MKGDKMNIQINPSLKSLIPALTPEEYRQLEINIIEDGCREPLILWGDVLIDGHNRYEICTSNEIEFKTVSKEFADENSAINWMIDNQLGRRNISQEQRTYLLGKRYKGEKKQVGENQYTIRVGQNVPSMPTAEKIATQNNVSEKTVKRAEKFADGVDKISSIYPELKEEILSGGSDFTQKEIIEIAKIDIEEEVKKRLVEIELKREAEARAKKEEKLKRFKEKKKEFAKEIIANKELDTFIFKGDCNDYMKQCDIKYDLVLSDPPYAMDFKSGWSDWDKIENDKRNDTINLLDETFKNLYDVMKDDAHIYVFGNPNEIENIKPLFTKYFKLKNMLIWDRNIIGMGDLKTYGRSYDVIYFGYKKDWKELNGTRDRDVLSFDRLSPNNLTHPTEKPQTILEYLIKKSSNEGDYIFDPFAGSGSLIKAGIKTGRNAHGCEIDSQYTRGL